MYNCQLRPVGFITPFSGASPLPARTAARQQQYNGTVRDLRHVLRWVLGGMDEIYFLEEGSFLFLSLLSAAVFEELKVFLSASAESSDSSALL
jgi:hypothetical protein